MRRWFRNRCVAAALLGASVLPLCAEHRERKKAERVEIQQMESRWRDAQLADDIGSMDKLLSDEFLGVTANGQVVTKNQQLERMRTRRLELRRLDVSDSKIKISGNLAVVTSLAQIEGTADGTPLHGAFRYTRVYHRTGGDGWRITNFEVTRVSRPGDLAQAAPLAGSRGPAAAVPSSMQASPGGPSSPRPQS